jgi:putative transposase
MLLEHLRFPASRLKLIRADAGYNGPEHNISANTFYAWKSKFGGMNVNEAQRLRQLEAENTKLKRIVAEQAMDNIALKDLLSKNW